jgi:predicted RNA-binding Zn-ribbon protein involved in translation (DUF1610 family)
MSYTDVLGDAEDLLLVIGVATREGYLNSGIDVHTDNTVKPCHNCGIECIGDNRYQEMYGNLGYRDVRFLCPRCI